jgi:hypothetical protein
MLRFGSYNRIANAPVYDKKTESYRRPNKFAPKGMSDIIGVTSNGLYVAIEVKSPDEYKWVIEFYRRIYRKHYEYRPISKREQHVLNQIIFIEEKIACGGIGFFTYSLEDCRIKLGKAMTRREVVAPISVTDHHFTPKKQTADLSMDGGICNQNQEGLSLKHE